MWAERDPCRTRDRRAADCCGASLLEGELRLVFRSSPQSVRCALRSSLGGLSGLDLTGEEAATVELALAEVLNNVVEHACGSRPTGVIEVHLRNDERGLECTVRDDGAPMPDGRLPPGRIDWGATVPEGGFGWYLIRALSRDLRYEREGGRNALRFRLPVGRAFRAS